MQSVRKELHGKSRKDVNQTGRLWRQAEGSRYSTDTVTRELDCLRESLPRSSMRAFQGKDANTCLPACSPRTAVGAVQNNMWLQQWQNNYVAKNREKGEVCT